MSRRLLATAVATLSLSACASLGTRDALISDRPDFTEATALVERGHVQVEAGSTVARESETRVTTHGEVLMRAGLSRRLELRVAGNSFVQEQTDDFRQSGMQDGSLGLKLRLFDAPETRSWRPEVSVIAHSTVPTGARLYRSQRAQPEVKVLTAWSLTDRLAFSSNFNVGRPYDGVRSFTEFAGSGSFGFAASDRVGVYAEAFAFAPQDGSKVVSKYVNSGITFLFSPDVQLDVRGGIGPRSSTNRDYFAGVGLVVRR
jgi:hypothetical protein